MKIQNKTNYTYIIGIDISKKTLDFCLTAHNKPLYQGQVANTQQGLQSLAKKLKGLKMNLDQVLFCCENTGIYNSPLLAFAQKNHLDLWLETPLAIKKSLGLIRGKSHSTDALRMASYAYRHQDKSPAMDTTQQEHRSFAKVIQTQEKPTQSAKLAQAKSWRNAK